MSLSLQMIQSSKVNLVSDSVYSQMDQYFQRTLVSEHESILRIPDPNSFSHHLYVAQDNSSQTNDWLNRLSNQDLQNRCTLVLSDSMSFWTAQLLEAGAFDVIVGPLRFSEFHGKLTFYFSPSFQKDLRIKCPPFSLDLTPKEQQLFEFLLSHPMGVTRTDLMTRCWKGISVHPKTLDVHLFNLRQKLEKVGAGVRFCQGKWLIHYPI